MTIEPRKGLKFKAEATAAIARLMLTSAYREPLREPSCVRTDPPGLVTRVFHFTGKGRDVNVSVTAHAKVMVGLLKALRKTPSIQVAGSLASYRSWDTQYRLWFNWIHKIEGSHLAAHPCYGFHRCGRSLDLYNVTAEERVTMLSVRVKAGAKYIGFYDLLPQDPPHFTLSERG